MEICEVVQLMDPATGRLITERRYTEDDGDVRLAPRVARVEWWALMGVTVMENGRPIGQKPIPFQITANSRVEAFNNLESSMHEHGEAAKQQVAADLDQAATKNRRKIVLANAAHRVPLRA